MYIMALWHAFSLTSYCSSLNRDASFSSPLGLSRLVEHASLRHGELPMRRCTWLQLQFNRPDGRWIVRAVWQTAGLGCPLTSTSVVSRLRQDKSPLLNCSSGNAPGASAHLLVYLSPVYREPVRLTEMPPKEPELTGRPQRTAAQWGKVTLLLKLCGTFITCNFF